MCLKRDLLFLFPCLPPPDRAGSTICLESQQGWNAGRNQSGESQLDIHVIFESSSHKPWNAALLQGFLKHLYSGIIDMHIFTRLQCVFLKNKLYQEFKKSFPTCTKESKRHIGTLATWHVPPTPGQHVPWNFLEYKKKNVFLKSFIYFFLENTIFRAYLYWT